MKRGKGYLVFFAVLVIMLVWPSPANALEQKNASFSLESGTKHVTTIEFHPSENLMLRPAIAAGGVGSTSSLTEMAERHDAVAAINGTFFNAYDPEDLHPQGAIMIDREYVHIRGGSVVMGITASGELEFSFNNVLRIEGTINGSYDNRWNASFINHRPVSADERVIFTPDYREKRLSLPGHVFVVVSDGVVTAKLQDAAEIPDNGYVIAFGPAWTWQAEKFQIGDGVEYHILSSNVTDTAQHLISVGPKLMTDGQIDVDLSGFSDPKMTILSAQRSFIGKKADGTIVMGTVGNVTIPELAELAKRLGLTDAMNLDGGASSGLYYDGKLLTRPGRLLSNSLVVVRQPRSPRVQVNGEEQFFSGGYPYLEGGNMMVPAGLLEALGASLTWSGDKRTVTGRRLSETVQLIAGSNTALVNGKAVQLPAAPVVKDGRLYVPVRAITDAFGASAEWDAEHYMVSITSDFMSADRHYIRAVEMLDRPPENPDDRSERERRQAEAAGHLILALKLDPGHEPARVELARLGIEWDEDKVYCPPSTACLPIAWSDYRAGNIVMAFEAFTSALQVSSDAVQAHLGLGLIYRHPRVNDLPKAEEHLRMVMELAPDSEEAERARALLNEMK